MSLAQRRTTLDGIEAISLPPRRASGLVTTTTDDGEDGLGNHHHHHTTTTSLADQDNDDDRQQQQQHDGSGLESETTSTIDAAAAQVPAEDDGQLAEIWKTISYDLFSSGPPKENDDDDGDDDGGGGGAGGLLLPELQHYESFPAELGDHVMAYEVSTAKRVGQVIFAVVACVLASGIVCGFAALKPVLIAEGVYRSLCPPDWPGPSGDDDNNENLVPCPAQDMRLNLFFITASITLNVATVLAGWVLDHRGRRTCYLIAALVLFLGGACMSLAFSRGESEPGGSSESQDHFDGYIAGNLLLGLGGTFLFVSSYQLAHAFPRRAGVVVALVTGAFDASAAVFLFYRLAYERFSPDAWFVRPAHFFLAFALAVPALLVVAEFALMPPHGYHTRRAYQAAIARAQDASHDDDTTHHGGSSSGSSDIGDARDYNNNNEEDPAARRRQRRASRREAQLTALETVTGDATTRRADRAAARARQAASGVDGILQGLPVGRQVATPWFWLLLGLTVLQMTRMNYFIATVRAQYRYMLGNDNKGAEAVNDFFDVALPVAGVVTTPFIGVLLNEVPVWGTLAVLTVLIVVLGILNCVGTLAAGYATVVAFVLFRPLYYSAVSDYATKVFGFATFGRIYGTVICVSGAGQFVQPALDALTHGPLHNNPVPVNVAFAVAGSVLSAALTLFVYTQSSSSSRRSQRQRRAVAAPEPGEERRKRLRRLAAADRRNDNNDEDEDNKNKNKKNGRTSQKTHGRVGPPRAYGGAEGTEEERRRLLLREGGQREQEGGQGGRYGT